MIGIEIVYGIGIAVALVAMMNGRYGTTFNKRS